LFCKYYSDLPNSCISWGLNANIGIIYVSGLLLLSITDFGYPNLVALAIAVEKPISGVLKLATSVQYGEADETEENTAETHEHGRPSKPHLRTPSDDYV
jgi:hypothetical protein